MGHIVLDNPKFYVRTKKGTPKASVMKAVEKIIADIEVTAKAISK